MSVDEPIDGLRGQTAGSRHANPGNRAKPRSKVIHTQLVPQRGERAKKPPSRARPSPLAFRVRHKCGSPNICETDTATCASEAGGFTVERAVARVRIGNLGLRGSDNSVLFRISLSDPNGGRQIVGRRFVRVVAYPAFSANEARSRQTGTRPPPRCAQSVTSSFSCGMEIRLSRSSPIRRSWPAQATRRPHLRFRLGRYAEPTLGGGPRSGPHARQCRDDGSRVFPLSKSNGYFCRSDPKPAERLVQGLAEDSRAHRRHRRAEPRRALGLASQLHQSSRGACVVGTYSPLADRTSADRSRGAGRRQWLGVRSRGLLVAAGTTRRRLGDQGDEVTPQRSLESPHEPLGRAGSSGPRPIRRSLTAEYGRAFSTGSRVSCSVASRARAKADAFAVKQDRLVDAAPFGGHERPQEARLGAHGDFLRIVHVGAEDDLGLRA